MSILPKSVKTYFEAGENKCVINAMKSVTLIINVSVTSATMVMS